MGGWRSTGSLLAIYPLALAVPCLPYYDGIAAYGSFIFTFDHLLLHGPFPSIPTLTAYYASCSCLPQRSLAILNYKMFYVVGVDVWQRFGPFSPSVLKKLWAKGWLHFFYDLKSR